MKKEIFDSGNQKQMKKIGVVLDVLSQQWVKYFKLPLKYNDCTGHCKVTRFHKEDEKNLGSWLDTQCNAKKKETSYLINVETC